MLRPSSCAKDFCDFDTFGLSKLGLLGIILVNFSRVLQSKWIAPNVMRNPRNKQPSGRTQARVSQKKDKISLALRFQFSKSFYQHHQKVAFWLLLCSQKPPKNIPLVVLVDMYIFVL